jgi:uncharacterized protein (DUF2235 family)
MEDTIDSASYRSGSQHSGSGYSDSRQSDSHHSASLNIGTGRSRAATRKRLIVLCDGTWQDSTDTTSTYPSNVTRFARALSKWDIDDNNEELKQVIYYQKGVGTGFMDKFTGGKNAMTWRNLASRLVL